MGAVVTAPNHSEVLTWGTTVDLGTAARAFGLDVSAARRAFHAGTLPFTVLRVGNHKLRAVTSSVWAALGISPDGDAEAGPPAA